MRPLRRDPAGQVPPDRVGGGRGGLVVAVAQPGVRLRVPLRHADRRPEEGLPGKRGTISEREAWLAIAL